MRCVVTGSSGHLGEGLVRRLRDRGDAVVGIDRRPSPFTTVAGSITDPGLVRAAMQGAEVVFHTATLHKPHVATHPRRAFVDTNVTGTLTLLEAAVEAGVQALVFTSTTSVLGRALTPARGEPAVWVTEDTVPCPRNIYGASKLAAEHVAEEVHHNERLPVVILRTSRFFPEADDDPVVRATFEDENLKAVEYLHRRVALEDVVDAHLRAVDRASEIGFGRYIVSATTPLTRDDADQLRTDLGGVLDRRVPAWRAVFADRGWRLPDGLDRVYDNTLARAELGWRPRWDVAVVLAEAAAGRPVQTPLSRQVGAKGYHPGGLVDGMYRTP